MEHVSEVRRGLVMEGFVGKKKDFECDAEWDGEPVQVVKDGGDVLSGTGVSEEAGGGVLDVLKFVEEGGW